MQQGQQGHSAGMPSHPDNPKPVWTQNLVRFRGATSGKIWGIPHKHKIAMEMYVTRCQQPSHNPLQLSSTTSKPENPRLPISRFLCFELLRHK